MTYGDAVELGDGFHLERRDRSLDRVCPACHVPGKAFHSNTTKCIDCHRAYWREWARKNRDKRRAAKKRQDAKKKAIAEAKDRVLLAYAREDPEHFAEVWAEQGGPE